jgi:hypothetical protein
LQAAILRGQHGLDRAVVGVVLIDGLSQTASAAFITSSLEKSCKAT